MKTRKKNNKDKGTIIRQNIRGSLEKTEFLENSPPLDHLPTASINLAKENTEGEEQVKLTSSINTQSIGSE